VEPGEVRGIVGANGSGKSTLVKILSGYYKPDPGAYGSAWGQPLEFPIRRAFDIGIAIVHQDLALVPTLTVKEHLAEALGYGERSRLGLIKWRQIRAECEEILDSVEADIRLDDQIKDLHPTNRALLAILRETARASRHASGRQLLIFDEAEAYVDAKEREVVHGVIRRLAANGGAVIIISHRLGDVLSVCQTVSVLRDGQFVSTVESGSASEEGLATAMLGESTAAAPVAHRATPNQPVVLRAEGLNGHDVRQLSFELRKGECLGVTGMPGSGHEELPYLLVGARPASSGRLMIDGKVVKKLTPDRLLALGVALLPPDRRGQGGWIEGTARENMTITSMNQFWRRGHLRMGDEKRSAEEIMIALGVSPPLPDQQFGRFSGGNQQRILLGRWMMRGPKVLIVVSPTEAVDIRAREYILGTFIPEFCRSGGSILVASSDYDEVADVCDRVCVLQPGGGTTYLEGDLDPDRLFRLSHGIGNGKETSGD
jgi:ribose transport system ATP-binding protein